MSALGSNLADYVRTLHKLQEFAVVHAHRAASTIVDLTSDASTAIAEPTATTATGTTTTVGGGGGAAAAAVVATAGDETAVLPSTQTVDLSVSDDSVIGGMQVLSQRTVVAAFGAVITVV
jgi:hypothetical protein